MPSKVYIATRPPIDERFFTANSKTPPILRSRRAFQAGVTLVETMLALSIMALAFAGLYSLSGRTSTLVRKSEAASDAQRNCVARVDQLRSLGWSGVTNPSRLATLLATPTGKATFSKEVISVYEIAIPQTSPLPTPTPAPTPVPSSSPLFTITKTSNGAAVVNPSTFDATTSLAKLQLNFRVLTEWQSLGTAEQRELSTVISKSGAR